MKDPANERLFLWKAFSSFLSIRYSVYHLVNFPGCYNVSSAGITFSISLYTDSHAFSELKPNTLLLKCLLCWNQFLPPADMLVTMLYWTSSCRFYLQRLLTRKFQLIPLWIVCPISHLSCCKWCWCSFSWIAATSFFVLCKKDHRSPESQRSSHWMTSIRWAPKQSFMSRLLCARSGSCFPRFAPSCSSLPQHMPLSPRADGGGGWAVAAARRGR